MPGETGAATVPVNAPVKKVGSVVSHEEFDLLCVRHQSRVRELSEVRTTSASTGEKRKYTLAFVENFGIAVYSHQDATVWALEFLEMIELARAAGLDKEMPVIIVPGQEVRRG